MFKVLIIDDEIYISALIEKMIDWDVFGMSVVGNASDGVAGLKMIAELDPDIVIVDVRMPGFDGITLMQKARELSSNAKFIVISGHKNFEYAQSAIRYNVEDYLLKPIRKQELEDILKKLKSGMEDERLSRTKLCKMQDEMRQQQNRIRRHFIASLLQGELELSGLSLAELNDSYCLHFSQNIFAAMVLIFDFKENKCDETFLNELLEKAALDFSVGLREICSDVLYQAEGKQVVFLLNFSEQNLGSVRSAAAERFSALKIMLLKFDSISVTLAWGGLVRNAASLGESVCQAREIIKSRMALKLNTIVAYQDLTKNYTPVDTDTCFPQNFDHEFRPAVTGFDMDKISSLLESPLTEAILQSGEDPFLPWHVCERILRSFLDCLAQFLPESTDHSQLYAHLCAQAETCSDKNDLKNILLGIIQKMLSTCLPESAPSESPAVRIAKKYISENYRKPITLASISAVVNLNPVYFSYIFKKDSGNSFVNYLNHYRVKVAKDLLRNVKCNISEAALMAGFPNARYFSKVFQRLVGISPSDYKNRHA